MGDVNKLLKAKNLFTVPINVLPLNFKPIIWIFTEGEGDGIKSKAIFLNLFYFSQKHSDDSDLWKLSFTFTFLQF